MANPLSLIGLGVSTAATIQGGKLQQEAAGVQAQGAITQIQGQIMQTIAEACGMQVEATQYAYQAQAARYKAAVADVNANIADQNAAYERDVGDIVASQEGMKTRADVGAMKASQGASGIDVNSGSSVHVRESMIELGTYDEMTTRTSAARKAFAYGVEAMQDRSQADLYRYESSMNLAQKQNALTAAGMTMDAIPIQQHAAALAGEAGAIGAQAAMINTVGSVASKWLDAGSKIIPMPSFGAG